MKLGKIIDISRSVYPGMTIWPNNVGVEYKTLRSMKKGDRNNLSAMELGLHTGTHVDAPLHFVDGGRDVESLDLNRFAGIARLYDLSHVKGAITRKDLENLPMQEDEIVLLKTSNSGLPEDGEFFEDFIALDLSAAEYLVEKKVKTVGIDYLSIEGFRNRSQVHYKILSNEIGVVEGLRFNNVKEGTYYFVCLPLKLAGVEGSPARAVLFEIES